jgi:glucose/mannose transport system substrate-binding protein
MKAIQAAAVFLLTGALVGCGAKPPPVMNKATDLTFYSWWTGPGEAEALQAVLTQHKSTRAAAGFDVRLNNKGADLSQEMLVGTLSDQLAQGVDSIQVDAFDLATWRKAKLDPFERLNDLFDSEGWKANMVPEALAAVTVNGDLLALPVNLHRENGMFYNKRIFEEQHLAVPTNWTELVAACEALKTAGITPISTSHEYWVVRILFMSVALMTMGDDFFIQYFTGKADKNDPRLLTAIQNTKLILTKYAPADAGDRDAKGERVLSWDLAAKKLYSKTAAMYFHGDWAKGYYSTLGWTPGTDFGVVAAPGARSVFLFGSDAFVLPKGAKNRDEGVAFLKTWGSVEGQAVFNPVKGSTPSRLDVDPMKLDPVGRAIQADLQQAKHRLAVPSWVTEVQGASEACKLCGFGAWADGDIDDATLRAQLVANYPH